jgi:ornithine cyclodeaminase
VKSANQPVRILTGDDVAALLERREIDVVEAVRAAYLAHGRGEASLPHSTFLRFPDAPQNRIIALPALHCAEQTAGIKWISSFPGNTARGLERASAVIALNCVETGRVKALMDGAIISAKRTAASAVLAALHLAGASAYAAVSFVGGGVISVEVLRFMAVLLPSVRRVSVFDLDRRAAERFVRTGREVAPGVEVVVSTSMDSALRHGELVCFATTSIAPHVTSLAAFRDGATVLHLSLRDLSAECVLRCDNVVDDADHVCRAGTSLHLAAEKTAGRAFIRCSLAEILEGRQPPRAPAPEKVTVFSPFGLGILDIGLAQFVYRQAALSGTGLELDSLTSTKSGVFD